MEGVMLLKRLLARFTSPTPSGPPQVLRRFAPSEPLLSQDGVTVEAAAWRIAVDQPQTVRLFEVADPGVEGCLLTYRARLKTNDVQGRAYLELWCRLPGRGEFFSKGVQQSVSGTVDWATSEVPFWLKQGQRPDLLKLNLAVEGTGTLWVSDIEVLSTPLA
jgi:hypothetical protein